VPYDLTAPSRHPVSERALVFPSRARSYLYIRTCARGAARRFSGERSENPDESSKK